MFERQVSETIRSLWSIVGPHCPILVKDLLSLNSFDESYKAYFRALSEARLRIEQERRHEDTIYDYTAPELAQSLGQLDAKLKYCIRLDEQQLPYLLYDAVSKRLNFICRPRFTLRQVVYAGQKTIDVLTIAERLACFSDYPYITSGLRDRILPESKTSLMSEILPVVEFDRILREVDDACIQDLSLSQLLELLDPMFDFFSLTVSAAGEQRVPLEAIILYFDDKNYQPLVNTFRALRASRPSALCTRDDLADVLKDIFEDATGSSYAPGIEEANQFSPGEAASDDVALEGEYEDIPVVEESLLPVQQDATSSDNEQIVDPVPAFNEGESPTAALGNVGSSFQWVETLDFFAAVEEYAGRGSGQIITDGDLSPDIIAAEFASPLSQGRVNDNSQRPAAPFFEPEDLGTQLIPPSVHGYVDTVTSDIHTPVEHPAEPHRTGEVNGTDALNGEETLSLASVELPVQEVLHSVEVFDHPEPDSGTETEYVNGSSSSDDNRDAEDFGEETDTESVLVDTTALRSTSGEDSSSFESNARPSYNDAHDGDDNGSKETIDDDSHEDIDDVSHEDIDDTDDLPKGATESSGAYHHVIRRLIDTPIYDGNQAPTIQGDGESELAQEQATAEVDSESPDTPDESAIPHTVDAPEFVPNFNDTLAESDEITEAFSSRTTTLAESAESLLEGRADEPTTTHLWTSGSADLKKVISSLADSEPNSGTVENTMSSSPFRSPHNREEGYRPLFSSSILERDRVQYAQNLAHGDQFRFNLLLKDLDNARSWKEAAALLDLFIVDSDLSAKSRYPREFRTLVMKWFHNH